MKSPPDSAPDATPPADETQSPAQIRPRVPHDSRGVQAAMDVLDIAVRYNVRSQQTEVKLPGGFRTYGLDKSGVWERLTREQIECLRQLVKDKFTTSRKQAPARFSFDALLAGLQFSGQTRKVEPFAEYLESRPPWDRRPRLKTWLHRRALSLARPGDELQERLAEWASVMIPSLAVWRTFWPRPVKSDEHPILVGPHRAGKSTIVSRLLPPEERLNWHTDGLRFDDSPKRQMELMSGRVLVELAELQGLSKAQIANVKTFMTRMDDGVARRAWGRAVRSQPRRAVLIGTGNVGSANLPNDAALMRRFVPIDVDEAEGGLTSAREWLDANPRSDMGRGDARVPHAGGVGQTIRPVPAAGLVRRPGRRDRAAQVDRWRHRGSSVGVHGGLDQKRLQDGRNNGTCNGTRQRPWGRAAGQAGGGCAALCGLRQCALPHRRPPRSSLVPIHAASLRARVRRPEPATLPTAWPGFASPQPRPLAHATGEIQPPGHGRRLTGRVSPPTPIAGRLLVSAVRMGRFLPDHLRFPLGGIGLAGGSQQGVWGHRPCPT